MAQNGFEIRLEGLKELKEELVKLDRDIQDKVLRDTVRKSIAIGFNAVKAAAPKHSGEQSKMSQKYGSIVDNLKMKPSKKGKGFRSYMITTRKAFWAYFIEKGWNWSRYRGKAAKAVARQTGVGSRHIPANPWFDKAYKSAAQAMTQAIHDELKKALKRAADRMSKK